MPVSYDSSMVGLFRLSLVSAVAMGTSGCSTTTADPEQLSGSGTGEGGGEAGGEAGEAGETGSYVPGDCASLVLPDPALSDAVALDLGLPAGTPITANELIEVTFLLATESGIESLAGLECAVNLESLYVQGNAIADLSPLADLSSLRDLLVTNNAIADLSPLAGLTLENLQVQENAITDLSPVTSMTSLRTLKAGTNPLTDMSPVMGLDLYNLQLSDSGITTLTGLDGNASLTSLRISGLALDSLAPLSAVSALDNLYLERGGHTDVSELPVLSNLKYLYLGGNELNSVPDLTGFPGLRELDMSDNLLTTLQPISGSVGALTLDGNAVTDFSALAPLTLSRLSINRMMNAPSVATIPAGIHSIDATDSGITSLAGFPTGGEYWSLNLANNGITDLGPLAGATVIHCAYVNLSGNPVDETLSAAAMTSLCGQGAQLFVNDTTCNLEMCDQGG